MPPKSFYLSNSLLLCLCTFSTVQAQSNPNRIQLDQNEKDRIRLEEIYRQEVRATIATSKEENKIIKFLNTPLGLYLLSSVLIGALSFSYSKWSEARDVQKEDGKLFKDIVKEAKFRIRQIDIVISKAKEAGELLLKELESSGEIDEKKISNYIVLAGEVTACIRLGGIISFPSIADTVKVGINEYTAKDLLYKRGYKNEDYFNEDLFDLIDQIASIKPIKFKLKPQYQNDKSQALKNILSDLESISGSGKLEHIYKDWFDRSRGLGKYEDRRREATQKYVSGYGDKIREIYNWVDSVHKTWLRLKKNPFMSEFQSI